MILNCLSAFTHIPPVFIRGNPILTFVFVFGPALAGPTLKIDRAQLNAGDVWRGDAASYTFRLRNTGSAPLTIDVEPNCGCTLTKLTRVVAPYSSSEIKAEFHTGAYRGRVVKTLTLKTNDPAHHRVTLEMRANVKPVARVLPDENVLVEVATDRATNRDFEIEVFEPGDICITGAIANRAYASVKVSPMPAAGRYMRYRVNAVIEPDAPLGRSTILITLLTTSRRQPQIIINLTCEKGISVSPSRAYIGAISPSTPLPVTQAIYLTRRGAPFRVLRAYGDDPRVQLSAEPAGQGKAWKVSIAYNGGWPVGTAQTNIVIETDDPVQYRITVPVIASILPAS